MANQFVAFHFHAMDVMAPASQSLFSEPRQKDLNLANKRIRTGLALAEGIRKHSRRGRHSMNVEHVHVNEGGQAIVGSVTKGKGGGGE